MSSTSRLIFKPRRNGSHRASEATHTDTVIQSIEVDDDAFNIQSSDDELLAAALDRVERATSSVPPDPGPSSHSSDEYEIHRTAEASATPPPQLRASTPKQPHTAPIKRVSSPPARRQVSEPPIQISYDNIFEDIFDDSFAGATPSWLREDASLTDGQRLVPSEESAGKIEFAAPVATQDVDTQPESNGKSRAKRKDTSLGSDEGRWVEKEDTHSPLKRFRTPPKKPLSVTDFVSPAWCELQYWYSLIKFGRVRKTPAMKRGSSVHKKLEKEVHVAVPVDVQTREDTWGLRIWNIIQGLRTLRVTGMTRELELWGVLDGEVVNGIIDELSYTCPDPELEAQLSGQSNGDKKKGHDIQIEEGQATLEEFFKTPSSQDTIVDKSRNEAKKIYLTDVKTRNSKYPPKGVSLRPVHIQLMLYRKLLAALANNEVDASIVFKRYSLDPSAEFSDSLIEQVAGLDDNLDGTADENTYAPVEPAVQTAVELLQHNTLDTLWQLMLREFAATMPAGGDGISQILKVEFRKSKGGDIMAARTFQYREREIEEYVAEELRWWRGERPAKGVEVEEAFKCGICEFAEGCEWRKSKDEEAVVRYRNGLKTPEGVV